MGASSTKSFSGPTVTHCLCFRSYSKMTAIVERWKFFAKLFAGRLTSSEKSYVLYAFEKFVQKFCWCQLSRVSIWSQESYKLSQLGGSLTSREKSLKLSWSGLLSRPLYVNLKFLSFCFLCLREGGESKISLCYPRGLGASPQSFCERFGVI